MANRYIAKLPRKPSLPVDTRQGRLDLEIDREVEVDGVGMGVLSDGTPFLNQRGLARLCSVQNRHIGTLSIEWSIETPRVQKIKSLLDARGVILDAPCIEFYRRGVKFTAYCGDICLAILEYYAFEAGRHCTTAALQNFRKLASIGFREFIYRQVGYTISDFETAYWQIFKDRVSCVWGAVPVGYFSIFKEIAEHIITLGEAGLRLDENFVPDISVGQAWSSHWQKAELSKVYGHRQKYSHRYPDYFPQANSNPQMSWCYPESCLGEFRRWFRDDYVGEGRFKKYLTSAAQRHALPEDYVQNALIALSAPKLVS